MTIQKQHKNSFVRKTFFADVRCSISLIKDQLQQLDSLVLSDRSNTFQLNENHAVYQEKPIDNCPAPAKKRLCLLRAT